MTSVPERLAAAIAAVPFVQLPEGWEGGSGLNIPGLAAGLPLDDPWDAVAKAPAPGLTGEEVRFAVTSDGRTVSGGDASPETLEPLVRAVARHLDAPFWAIAVPDGDEWTAAGTAAEVLEVAGTTGDEVEASRVGGEISGLVDGEDAALPAEIAALLARQDGDTAILAHRFAGPVWVAEIYPL